MIADREVREIALVYSSTGRAVEPEVRAAEKRDARGRARERTAERLELERLEAGGGQPVGLEQVHEDCHHSRRAGVHTGQASSRPGRPNMG